MATKKSTKVTDVSVEEVVTPIEEAVISVETEKATVVEVADVEEVQEPIKKRVIIANSPTVFRKAISLEAQQIVGQMPVGVAYEIVKETTSKIYGDFYQLSNGYYVTKNGNYSIS